MIEFIGLCVCSACLSCICCLITGGLCMMPVAVRLRNKLIPKNLSDDNNMRWIESFRGSEIWESESSDSSSDLNDNHSKDYRSGGGKILSEEYDNDKENSLKRIELKKCTNSCKEKETPKRCWKFCFLGKSSRNSKECCTPQFRKVETTTRASQGEKEKILDEKFSCIKQNNKKTQTRKNSSGIYSRIYIKSCSCTNFKEPIKKRRCKKHKKTETSSGIKSSSKSHRDNNNKRRLKISKKTQQLKCPKNCRCKIINENKIHDDKINLKENRNDDEKKKQRCCNCSNK